MFLNEEYPMSEFKFEPNINNIKGSIFSDGYFGVEAEIDSSQLGEIDEKIFCQLTTTATLNGNSLTPQTVGYELSVGETIFASTNFEEIAGSVGDTYELSITATIFKIHEKLDGTFSVTSPKVTLDSNGSSITTSQIKFDDDGDMIVKFEVDNKKECPLGIAMNGPNQDDEPSFKMFDAGLTKDEQYVTELDQLDDVSITFVSMSESLSVTNEIITGTTIAGEE